MLRHAACNQRTIAAHLSAAAAPSDPISRSRRIVQPVETSTCLRIQWRSPAGTSRQDVPWLMVSPH